MKNSIKALLMFIVTTAATILTQTGIPATTIGWTVLGITVGGASLIYIGKNYLLPSISIFGSIDLRDLLSGLIVALGVGISNWAATLAVNAPVNWGKLWQLIISVTIGYFVLKFASKPTEPALKRL